MCRPYYYESESWKDRVITTVQDRKESKLTILLMAVNNPAKIKNKRLTQKGQSLFKLRGM